jgi:hypothetical protein
MRYVRRESRKDGFPLGLSALVNGLPKFVGHAERVATRVLSDNSGSFIAPSANRLMSVRFLDRVSPWEQRLELLCCCLEIEVRQSGSPRPCVLASNIQEPTGPSSEPAFSTL